MAVVVLLCVVRQFLPTPKLSRECASPLQKKMKLPEIPKIPNWYNTTPKTSSSSVSSPSPVPVATKAQTPAPVAAPQKVRKEKRIVAQPRLYHRHVLESPCILFYVFSIFFLEMESSPILLYEMVYLLGLFVMKAAAKVPVAPQKVRKRNTWWLEPTGMVGKTVYRFVFQ